MTKGEIEEVLSAFTGAEESFPFGPETLVFKVMGKMFALVSQNEETPRVTLKCKPERGVELVEAYSAIIPGYYMNKKHWVTISLNGDVDSLMLKELAANSYGLVVSKLKKSEKEQLQKR